MSKVRRKTNSFATALQDAAKRLAKATKEREAAVSTLATLDAEIPALQQTIAALERQLHPTKVPKAAEDYMKGLMQIADKVAGVPFSLLPESLTEEDTLPEPDGQPLTPEE